MFVIVSTEPVTVDYSIEHTQTIHQIHSSINPFTLCHPANSINEPKYHNEPSRKTESRY